MQVRGLSILLFLLSLHMFCASAGSAQPRIVQTGCSTLSLGPPLVGIEFGVVDEGTIGVCEVQLSPLQSGSPPSDSCHVLECSSPPEWSCLLGPDEGGGAWQASSAEGPAEILPGKTLAPFGLVVDPLTCCYSARFYACGILEPFHVTMVCFECDKPVQSLSSTWGRLKSFYR